MSDTPPPDAPPPDPPPPETSPETPAPPPVPEAPRADPPVTKADLDAVADGFRQAITDLGTTLTGALSPNPSPVLGAGAPAPAPTPRKDPRSRLQRVWFGPRRFS